MTKKRSALEHLEEDLQCVVDGFNMRVEMGLETLMQDVSRECAEAKEKLHIKADRHIEEFTARQKKNNQLAAKN